MLHRLYTKMNILCQPQICILSYGQQGALCFKNTAIKKSRGNYPSASSLCDLSKDIADGLMN